MASKVYLCYHLDMILTPRLDILPAPQYRLWPELIDTPKHFVLYGGTAIALRLGHRQSIDFDFFSSECFHPSELLRDIPYLKDAMPILSQNNSLVCAIDRGGTVKLSFFGGLSFGHIQSPDEAENTFISVASLLDLMASKLKVIQDRAEYKDYFDLYTLLQHDLFENGLGAAQAIYGASFNPLLSLKALGFFDDGDLAGLSDEIKAFLISEIRRLDLRHLPRYQSKVGLRS